MSIYVWLTRGSAGLGTLDIDNFSIPRPDEELELYVARAKNRACPLEPRTMCTCSVSRRKWV